LEKAIGLRGERRELQSLTSCFWANSFRKHPMIILDLFSGIGGFSKAFNDLFGTDHTHYYSEIDPYAIAVYKKQFPESVFLGDIVTIDLTDLPKIDFLFSGSPCQNLSIAKKKREGLEGAKSGLFYNAVEVWRATNPTYWIFENVASMSKKDKDIISKTLGVEPILINSSLVSAQHRKRLFWTNITGIKQPVDRGVFLKDILETNPDQKFVVNREATDKFLIGGKPKNYKEPSQKSNALTASMHKGYGNEGMTVVSALPPNSEELEPNTEFHCVAQRGRQDENGKYKQKTEARQDQKTNSLTTVQKDNLVSDSYTIRKLTPVECARLQTFPDDWNATGTFETKRGTEELPISTTQRYKQFGNAVTVDVIKEILKVIIPPES
jgi:DNA (cytosine-5)-methyltransferase 3A